MHDSARPLARAARLAPLALAAAALAAPAAAQAWSQQYPPQLPDAVSVDVLSGLDAWVAQADGTLRHTTDGGVNWVDVDPGGTALAAVRFASGGVGLAAGDGVRRTDDAGQSWELTSLETVVAASLPSAQRGWILTEDGRVQETQDGGATWLDRGQPAGATPLRDVHFRASGRGYVCGDGGTLYGTNDGGLSWIALPVGTTGDLRAVFFVDTQNGWVCVGPGLRRTTDGGATWTAQTTPSGSALSDVMFLTDQRGWAAGAGGTLLSTSDGGATWTLGSGGGSSAHAEVEFADFFSGFAVGSDGRVLRSADGGASWTQVAGGTPVEPPSVRGLSALDAQHAWAATSDDAILRTVDGGATWTPHAAGVNFQWWDVDFFDAQHGYACGERQAFFPSIAWTSDGGLSWNSVSYGLMVDFNAVVALGPDTALVTGDTWVWRTTDGGLTWPSVTPQPSGTFHGMDFVDAQTGWIGGTLVFRSDDGGATWAYQIDPPETVRDVDFVDAQVGWCVCDNAVVMKTVDGGATWSFSLAPGAPGGLYGVSAVDAQNVWIVGGGGYVARSTDGGATWQQEQPGLEANAQPYAVEFVDPERGWIAGWTGMGIFGRASSAFAPYCFGDGSGAACPCGNVGAPGRGCDNSFATGGGRLSGVGEASVAGDSAALLATGLPSSAPTLFFQGLTEANGGAGNPFGDGLVCVGGTVIRLRSTAAQEGSASYPGAGDPPISVKGQVPSTGGPRTYQAWYRNAADYCGPAGFNLTNALRVDWTR